MKTLSIVIPVYNKWELTKQCLTSLAITTQGFDDLEVLLVDNASSDATAVMCADFGSALFNDRFHYLRMPMNYNFAGACNRGAKAAKGRYVFFLNNDTVLLENWYEPLLKALTNGLPNGLRPSAVGPLLLYPDAFGFKDRVQHLGVALTPRRSVTHLYEYLPANHPLCHKTRSFQAITAAALLMPLALFEQMGCFDEGYINGFEDLALCAQLKASGHTMTCVSDSRIYHLCSQTPGRNDHDQANAERLFEQCSSILTADEHALVQADGYRLKFTAWHTFMIAPPIRTVHMLHRTLQANPSRDCALDLIRQEPFWFDGYLWLADYEDKAGNADAAMQVASLACAMDASPSIMKMLWQLAKKHQQDALAADLYVRLRSVLCTKQERLQSFMNARKTFRGHFPELVEDIDKHLSNEDVFYQQEVVPLASTLAQE